MGETFDRVKHFLGRVGNSEPLPEGMNAKEFALRKKIEVFDQEQRIKDSEARLKLLQQKKRDTALGNFVHSGFAPYRPQQPRFVEESSLITGKKIMRKVV